jgi:hypothetical protein
MTIKIKRTCQESRKKKKKKRKEGEENSSDNNVDDDDSQNYNMITKTIVNNDSIYTYPFSSVISSYVLSVTSRSL